MLQHGTGAKLTVVVCLRTYACPCFSAWDLFLVCLPELILTISLDLNSSSSSISPPGNPPSVLLGSTFWMIGWSDALVEGMALSVPTGSNTASNAIKTMILLQSGVSTDTRLELVCVKMQQNLWMTISQGNIQRKYFWNTVLDSAIPFVLAVVLIEKYFLSQEMLSCKDNGHLSDIYPHQSPLTHMNVAFHYIHAHVWPYHPLSKAYLLAPECEPYIKLQKPHG